MAKHCELHAQHSWVECLKWIQTRALFEVSSLSSAILIWMPHLRTKTWSSKSLRCDMEGWFPCWAHFIDLLLGLFRGAVFRHGGGALKQPIPKGPKIEKIQDRPPGLKFSIEIENFNPDTQQTPIFLGGNLKVRIENFNRDWNFQARLKFSIEIDFFQSLGP